MPEPVFRLGRYWLVQVLGSDRWYRAWYDAGAGEVRRRSLKTTDLETAKVTLAALVLKEGSGRAADPVNVPMIAVLTHYWEQHSDRTRSRTTARLGGGKILDFLGNDAKVAAFTRARQREFFQLHRAQGSAIATIASWMTLAQAALNFAVAADEDETGTALLTRAPRLIYSAKGIAEVLREPEPEPRNWSPDLDMIVTFLDGLTDDDEPVRRFTIIKIAFACRSEAALDTGPFLLDKRSRTIRLNPPGRRQTKKHRPVLPVPAGLWPVLTEEWTGEATFAHIDGRKPAHLTKQWNAARDRLGLPPEFIPHSLRHFMVTELRHAHLRYGVPRVPWDECEMWLGHRRGSAVHAAYGEFEPDYLLAAKTAVEAILSTLSARLKKPFYRQPSAKSLVDEKPVTNLKIVK